MISKSLSRKTPSFGQLAGYMSESGYMNSQKSDADYQIFHNCFSRNSEDIAAEFYQNSQLLPKRKNGNYLYHDVLSITIEDGVDRAHAKEALRELALIYIDKRCPRNMVYGCLHDDHAGHIHYHLMISANEKGSSKRYWITKTKLDQVKRETEDICLKDYPELKQRPVMTASQSDKKLSRKAAEQKRRAGRLERYQEVKSYVLEAMIHTQSLDEFSAKLQANGCSLYQYKSMYGVEFQHTDGQVKKYRLKTVGVDEDFKAFLANVEALKASEQNSDLNEAEQADAAKAADQSKNDPEQETETQNKSDQQTTKSDQKDDDMKLKDVAGVTESYKEKSKKPTEPTKDDIKKAKEETIQRLEQEFKSASKGQGQSQGQGQGQKK